MKRWLPLAFALAAVAVCFPPLSAQRPLFTTGTAAELAQARSIGLDHLRAIASQKGIDDASDLVVSNAHVDRVSMAHVRVQQRFHGIPVLGGEAIAHLNADGSHFADTDSLVAAINVSTTPTLTADAAINVAVADYGCRGCLTRVPTADLWIVRDNAGVDHLTYRVQLVRLDGSNRTALPVRFVDAHGGYVVLAYDNLQTGTGNSLYSGEVLIGTYHNPTTGDYVMQNLGLRVGTFDLRNGYSTSTFYPFLNASDDWTSFAQSPGVDVHYAMERDFDYLLATHGWNGIDGGGGPFTVLAADGVTSVVASMVHYGVNYDNAFWDPTKKSASFGDGDGTSFSPLVTLDIVGHELMHGVTQFTANLIYQNESGALNESWSDVFGAMLERYVRGESENTWLLGEQAYTPAVADDALRYMDNPHRGYQPDHYSERFICDDEPQFCDNGGVHINSGIANNAFYLLAQGGTHRLGGSMTGIGADAAARIWFTALTSYMTSSTTFGGARAATTFAAEALYGSDSDEYRAVARAWCLVGVGTCLAVEAVSVSPDGGAGATQTFTLQYSDTAGAGDLKSARVRFATSASQSAGSCSISYDATLARVMLMDDGGTWGAAVPLGSGLLSNSQCTLDLASSQATSSGNILTLVLSITFNGSFTGAKNIYMSAASVSPGVTTGWVQRGTWSPSGVTAFSVTPIGGVGLTQAFTLRYADSQGALDLVSARVRFESSNAGPGNCSARYNAATGVIGLLNDAGTVWSEGPIGSGSLANSQCTLNLASSSATASGTNLTVVLTVTFSSGFSGVKQIYMRAAGLVGGNTLWQQRGTWTVPESGPSALVVAPSSGSGITQAFSLRYSNTSGATNLTSARIRFGASNVGPGTCTASYNAMQGTIALLNDAGTAWTAGTIGIGTLANSQCTLDLSASSATTNATDVFVTLSIRFSASFDGVKNIYMLAASVNGPSTGWVKRGTWTVPKAVISAVSVTPISAAGLRQVFTLKYSDSYGAGDLTSVRVRFGSSNSGPGTCTARYSPMTGVIELLNDDASAWAAGALGSGTLANSQCTLNLASSSVTSTFDDLTLVLDVSLSDSFLMNKNIYLLATGSGGAKTGWQLRGGWSGPSVAPTSLAPQFGAGAIQAFTLKYFDSLGALDLSSASVRFGATNAGPGTCTARYNASAGTIELLNDAGTSWQSGTMGNGSLANGQCTLNLAESVASINNTDLTLVLKISFAASFTGLKNVYMLAEDPHGLSSGWSVKGTWTPNPDSQAPVDLGTLGGSYSFATDVNASGQVVGQSQIPSAAYNYHAFSWTQAGGIVDLGTLGGPNSQASAVNANGDVIGNSDLANGSRHGFLWTQANGMLDLGTLGGTSSQANAVNAHGQVVGESLLPNGVDVHAFSWTQAGGMVDIGTLGGPYSYAFGLNDNGQVVGYSSTADGSSHAFIWTAASGMRDLGTLGGTDSHVYVVNANGQVVGNSSISGSATDHAILWTDAGGMVDLTPLASTDSLATDVNDAGQVVGFVQHPAPPGQMFSDRAFVWTQAGGKQNLGTLGGDWSQAEGINSHGQVVGNSTVANGSFHAFMWTEAGGMVDLGTLGGSRSWVSAINDNCQAVGDSDSTVGYSHATLWNLSPCAPVQAAPTR